MKAAWLKWMVRFDALQSRERYLVALAVIGGILMVGYSLFVEPAMKKAQLSVRTAREQGALLASVESQVQAMLSPAQDPDAAAQAELANLRQQLSEMAGRLERMESTLVPPQRMATLLEDMVGRKPGLQLISLKTQAATPLLEKKSKAKAEAAAPEKPEEKTPESPEAPAAGLYKHGVEIKLEGSYAELTAYLTRLEQANMKLLWSNMTLSAENHPRLTLTLTVYTLSLDKAWLVV